MSFVCSGGSLVPAKIMREERKLDPWCLTNSLSEGHIFLLARSPFAPMTTNETPVALESLIFALIAVTRRKRTTIAKHLIAAIIASGNE